MANKQRLKKGCTHQRGKGNQFNKCINCKGDFPIRRGNRDKKKTILLPPINQYV